MNLLSPLPVSVATVVVMWVIPAAIYRWVYRRPLRWYAMPLALGALVLGTRLESLERRGHLSRSGRSRQKSPPIQT
jgi:hypothetical protein